MMEGEVRQQGGKKNLSLSLVKRGKEGREEGSEGKGKAGMMEAGMA